MEQALVELNQKIETFSSQIDYLTKQAQINERRSLDRAELMRDLTPLATEAYHIAIEQLEEIQDYIELNDLVRILKRMLRNGRNIEKMFDQLESLMDLADTLGPLGDEAFAKLVKTLADMEQKGYFGFARGGKRILDNVVTSFDEEDVNRLGDNIVLILTTIKEMTQPEIMSFIRNTLLVAEKEIDKPVDISFAGLFKQMRDPNVRRGLALTMRVMNVVGAQADGNGHEK